MNLSNWKAYVVLFIVLFTLFGVLFFFHKTVKGNKEDSLARQQAMVDNLFRGISSLILFLLSFYSLVFVTSSKEISFSQEWFGQFGDYFGGVLNPIVSFAALFGLWKTLEIQRETNSKNENYLKAQIQKDEDKHKDLMFIELMAQYRSILDDVEVCEVLENPNKLQGKLKLKNFRDSILVGEVFKEKLPENITNDAELNQYIVEFFPNSLFYTKSREIASKNIHTFGDFCDAIEVDLVSLKPYFRIVYHILRLQSKIKSDLKYKNSKYFRAQLTEVELQLIAINAMFDPEGIKGMQELLKEFALFKHMRDPILKRFVTCKIGDECFFNENENKYDNS